jgi:chemotaxis protein histidine kinase CheA
VALERLITDISSRPAFAIMKPAGNSFDGVELPNRGSVQEEDSERRRGSQQGGFDSYSGTVLAILVLGGICLIGWFAVSSWSGGKSNPAPAPVQDTCKSYECKQDGFVLKEEPEEIKGTMTDETCCEAKTAKQAKTADTVPHEDAKKENGGTDEKPAAEKEAAEKPAAEKEAAEKAAAEKEAAEKAAAEKEAAEKAAADKEAAEKAAAENPLDHERNLPLGTACWEFNKDGHNEKSQKERDERCGKGLVCARFTHDQKQGFLGWTTLGKADWRKECEDRGWGDENCNSIGGSDKFRCSTDPGEKEVKKCNVVDGSKFTAETCGCGTNICKKDEYCIIDHSGKKAEEKRNPCVAMCKETNGMKQNANKCMCSTKKNICEVNEFCFIQTCESAPPSMRAHCVQKALCESVPQGEPPKEFEQAADADSKDPADADSKDSADLI